MDSIVKLKQILLIIGDLAVLYLSLCLTLLLRYGDLRTLPEHLGPFTFVFLFWVITTYVAGLYSFQSLKNCSEFQTAAAWVFGINALIAVLFFYFAPGDIVTPKTNLFIFLGFAGSLGYFWRTWHNNLINRASPASNILLVGYTSIADDLAERIGKTPQLGYRLAYWMKEGLQDKEFAHLAEIILAHRITTIVVPAHLKKHSRASKLIYKNLALGIEVVDLAEIYEKVFGKVPLTELEEVWFLENLAKRHRVYEAIKRPAEFTLALFAGAALLPLAALVSAVIAFSSRGPIVFSQKRVGKAGEIFAVYKFRTMRQDAEKDGPQWARKDDNRVTAIGKFLRRTHLDELPQLWNVLRGDLSLIGPRPERPEFVEQLQREIPFYELRHLVRPGITGWAQVNYRYGASVQDAYEKLQYDIHYLKNRSLFLDFLITLKTLKFFFSNL